MTLPTYSGGSHHIGLSDGGTTYGFMLMPGYVRDLQREAMGAPDMGGATDLIGQIPSMSRVTQDDFTGGAYGYNWGRDDAMFAECVGFIPGPQSRSLFSCPPMYLKLAVDSDTRDDFVSNTPRSMFMVGGYVYIFWGHTACRIYTVDNSITWLDIDDITAVTTFVFRSAEYNTVDQKIWAVCSDSGGTYSIIFRIKPDFSGLAAFDDFYTGPDSTDAAPAGLTVYGATIFNGNIVMQYGRKVYVGDPPDNPDPSADDDTVVWTKMGVMTGRWWDSCPYSGILYILTNDGSFKSTVYAFDGDSIMPICSLPFSFYGKCITEYAGRIYVGGTGTDINGGEHYAELYEITGASVRLVRSFSPETRHQFLGGVAGEWPRSFDDMAVHEGMLWMCQKGKKMIAYDVTSDGFFGAAEILSETDLNMAKMTTGRGRIWCYGIDDDEDANHGLYRIAQPADTVGTWYPTLVTSDFAYEPAMKKRWSQLTVMSKYAGCSSIEYSVDGGESWTSLTLVEETANNKTYWTTASLAAITPTRMIRFRIKLNPTSPQDAKTYHRELVAWSMSFAMLDTGKWAWSFVVNGADEIESRAALLSEATTVTYAPEDIRSKLSTWAKDKTPLTFTDLDDDTYNVHIVGYREVQPVIGPDITTEPEAQFTLTLLEV